MKSIFQAIHWEYDKQTFEEIKKGIDCDPFTIRVYGLTESNETICAIIRGFNPYIYITLPDVDSKENPITWTRRSIEEAKSILIRKLFPYDAPANPIDFDENRARWNLDISAVDLVEMGTFRKLNGFNKKGKIHQEKINAFRISVEKLSVLSAIKGRIERNRIDMNPIAKVSGNTYRIDSLGTSVNFIVHEDWIDPLIKFMAWGNITTVGWKKLTACKHIDSDSQITTCKYEFECDYQNIIDCPLDEIPKKKMTNPLIVAIDIETYSSRSVNIPNAMPNRELQEDVIYMVSLIFNRYMSNKYKKYIICCRPCKESKNYKLIKVKTESELLLKVRDLLTLNDPDIIIGHNILNYDFSYMARRSGAPRKGFKDPDWMTNNSVWSEFSELGRIKNKKCKIINNDWSSSAYSGMNFEYINIDGRLLLDTHPYMKRTYPALDSHKLDFIAQKFLKEGKFDLDYNTQFEYYRTENPKKMRIIGEYCMQDSMLTLKLLYKMNIWIDLNEIASVVGIPIFELYTRGQSRRGASQIYRKAYNDYVIDLDRPAEVDDKEKYQGAYIVTPVPGLYENVICMDFASLYPSMIRAYNLDYTTFVPEDSKIPDEMCNIIEWDETKKNTVIHYRYRFIKAEYHRGIIPSILDDLTIARDKVKLEMKKHEMPDSDGKPLEGHEIEFAVCNSQQKELKVSSNSVYGLMGFKKGRLGLMPGAMSTTALGRQSIEKVIKYISDKYATAGGKLIYGDTDSAMFNFSTWDFTTSYDNGTKLAAEVSILFPKPMKLNFEKIFRTFLILTKKRYAGYICARNGEIVQFMKKGLLLARRDYCQFAKNVYETVIKRILDESAGVVWKGDKGISSVNNLKKNGINIYDDIIYYINNQIKNLMSHNISMDDIRMRVTWKPKIKVIVETDNGPVETWTYKSKIAHNILVQKLLAMGKNIQSGDVVYYILVEKSGAVKKMDIIEDPELHSKDPNSRINYKYYLEHQLEKNLTDIIKVVFPDIKGSDSIIKKLLRVHWFYNVSVAEVKYLWINAK